MIQRRGFLAGILACAAAPAIVRAGSLMKIYVPSQEIILSDGAQGYIDNLKHSMEHTAEVVRHEILTSGGLRVGDKITIAERYEPGTKALQVFAVTALGVANTFSIEPDKPKPKVAHRQNRPAYLALRGSRW